MVIHDLRNPTAQIKFAIEFAQENYEKSYEKQQKLTKRKKIHFEKYKDFMKSNIDKIETYYKQIILEKDEEI